MVTYQSNIHIDSMCNSLLIVIHFCSYPCCVRNWFFFFNKYLPLRYTSNLFLGKDPGQRYHEQINSEIPQRSRVYCECVKNSVRFGIQEVCSGDLVPADKSQIYYSIKVFRIKYANTNIFYYVYFSSRSILFRLLYSYIAT